MKINLPETRRQYAIATQASGYSLLSTWAIFAGPPLMDAAEQRDELLTALQGAVAAWDRHYSKFPVDVTVEDDECGIFVKARSAIARATGAA